jgi:hypothetical protein
MKARIEWTAGGTEVIKEFQTEKELLDYCFGLHDKVILMKNYDPFNQGVDIYAELYNDYRE